MAYIIRLKNAGSVTYLGPLSSEAIAHDWVKAAKEYLATNYPDGEFKRARFNVIPLMSPFKSQSVQVLNVVDGAK